MGKKSGPPKPPDPMETASSQFDMNSGTAFINQLMGQVNQNTPYGSLNYSQTGKSTMTNPFTGQPMEIPQFTATTTLSPEQQRLQNIQTQGETNLAKLGRDQSARLGGILGKPMDLSGAPNVSAPNLRGVGEGPNLREGIAPSGDIKRHIQDAGPMSHSIRPAGDITETYGTDFSKDRRRVEEALYSRLNPELERGRSRLETQLSNQGIKQGSAAYDRALQNFGQQENDARMQTILAGGQEQSRMTGLEAARAAFENQAQGQQFGQNAARSAFHNDAQAQKFGQNAADAAFYNQGQAQRFGQNVTSGTFLNDARQQEFANKMAGTGFNNQAKQQGFGNDQSLRSNYLQEQYAARNQPINEIGALLGTGQVNSPNFVNTPQTQLPNIDYSGLVGQNYNQRLAGWQQQQANNPMNGIMGGLFGLGSAGIMASDRRLKTDVARIGIWKSLPLYLFRYIWGGPMQVGVMAQDVLRVKPEAVVPFGQWLAVDYARL